MSRKDLLKISLVLTLVACASSAYAAVTITTTTAIGNSSFSPSANVSVAAANTTTGYEAVSWHASGNRSYYGNNTDPKIYYTNATGATLPNGTLTGWSSL